MFATLRRCGNRPVLVCPEAVIEEAAAPAVEPVLPVEYRAFCLLHQERYMRYTRERVQDMRMSRQVVGEALGNLAMIWPAVISSPRPAAVAWRLLNTLISSEVRHLESQVEEPVDAVHQVLPSAQADAVILRCRLQLDDRQAAELMGVEASAVASQLLMAERTMPGVLTAPPSRSL
ncbi:hypothetical protein [Actinacidiphila glaucinigra]|uniref:RNA polymerase sigma factor 70 region 4 type 2 domain-containing protein n=1 Tax=Actinacidiphila glaucinigra TaxID=235986 RepID=A0A239NN42_9ACTN|nr:hypothetical protein [Actinacidiphila glaucinigra]SNT56265.1 hypothetical protein SAMN05216252_14132 [Actinacidiphila glaucinigra]